MIDSQLWNLSTFSLTVDNRYFASGFSCYTYINWYIFNFHTLKVLVKRIWGRNKNNDSQKFFADVLLNASYTATIHSYQKEDKKNTIFAFSKQYLTWPWNLPTSNPKWFSPTAQHKKIDQLWAEDPLAKDISNFWKVCVHARICEYVCVSLSLLERPHEKGKSPQSQLRS